MSQLGVTGRHMWLSKSLHSKQVPFGEATQTSKKCGLAQLSFHFTGISWADGYNKHLSNLHTDTASFRTTESEQSNKGTGEGHEASVTSIVRGALNPHGLKRIPNCKCEA